MRTSKQRYFPTAPTFQSLSNNSAKNIVYYFTLMCYTLGFSQWGTTSRQHVSKTR